MKRKSTRDMNSHSSIPEPFKREHRCSFSLAWFLFEKDADKFADYVSKNDYRYNGGYLDNMKCGRERSFDYTDEMGRKLYAVSC